MGRPTIAGAVKPWRTIVAIRTYSRHVLPPSARQWKGITVAALEVMRDFAIRCLPDKDVINFYKTVLILSLSSGHII